MQPRVVVFADRVWGSEEVHRSCGTVCEQIRNDEPRCLPGLGIAATATNGGIVVPLVRGGRIQCDKQNQSLDTRPLTPQKIAVTTIFREEGARGLIGHAPSKNASGS